MSYRKIIFICLLFFQYCLFALPYHRFLLSCRMVTCLPPSQQLVWQASRCSCDELGGFFREKAEIMCRGAESPSLSIRRLASLWVKHVYCCQTKLSYRIGEQIINPTQICSHNDECPCKLYDKMVFADEEKSKNYLRTIRNLFTGVLS